MHGTVFGDLSIDVGGTPEGLELTWRGSSNSRNPGEALRAYFKVALAEAATRRAKLDLHFEHLIQFNSSTVSVLLHLVDDAAAQGVPMTYFYDGGLRWQAHNFESIALLKRDVKTFSVRKVGGNEPAEKVGPAR
jgi:hypothetical protein